jgi:hypothetical protein
MKKFKGLFKKKPEELPHTYLEVMGAIKALKRLGHSPKDQAIIDEAATQKDKAGKAANAFIEELEREATALPTRREQRRAKEKAAREAAEKKELEKEKGRKKGKR